MSGFRRAGAGIFDGPHRQRHRNTGALAGLAKNLRLSIQEPRSLANPFQPELLLRDFVGIETLPGILDDDVSRDSLLGDEFE